MTLETSLGEDASAESSAGVESSEGANPVPIFDGHNDTVLRLHLGNQPPSAFLQGRERGHLDLPRARAGGFAGGLFAMFTPSQQPTGESAVRTADGYTVPFPGTPTVEQAQKLTLALMARLRRLERAANGNLAICTDVAAIRRSIAAGTLAAVLHLEGAEAIDPDLDALEVFHAAGLRSLGPVWSRPNMFGHGVPFRFPSAPDIGPGLSDAGKALVRGCNELGIVVDLAHLNEQGFWDVAKLTTKPLVASHANAHAVCPASRNLTDRQLDAIAESRGLVGINFSVSELRPDGHREADTPLTMVAEMIDHLVGRLGIDGVGFGSDFDGCIVPRPIGDAAGLQRVIATLRTRGYDEVALRKLGHENWLRVLEQTWGA